MNPWILAASAVTVSLAASGIAGAAIAGYLAATPQTPHRTRTVAAYRNAFGTALDQLTQPPQTGATDAAQIRRRRSPGQGRLRPIRRRPRHPLPHHPRPRLAHLLRLGVARRIQAERRRRRRRTPVRVRPDRRTTPPRTPKVPDPRNRNTGRIPRQRSNGQQRADEQVTKGTRHAKEIRAWARANDVTCPKTGFIPKTVIDAWEAR
jgi:hypothetical protein